MTDFVQPNYTLDSGANYPLHIDQAIASLAESSFFSNYIINGNFLIDQINEGALYTTSNASTQSSSVDGWFTVGVSPGTLQTRRVTDPDYPHEKCLEITCTSPDTSISTNDRYALFTFIEGTDIADLNLGVSTAANVTLAFDMNFSVAGNYGVALRNGPLSRAYVAMVTQNNASVRESKKISLVLDTTGNWPIDNSVGLEVHFTLAAGANYQTASTGVWINEINSLVAGNVTTSAQANFMSANTSKGYLGRFRLMRGTDTPPVIRTNYATALRRCQRYQWKSFAQGVQVKAQSGGYTIIYRATNAGANYHAVTFSLPVTMRATPVVNTYNPASNNAQWRNQTLGADSGSSSISANDSIVTIFNPQVSGDQLGNSICIDVLALANLSRP
jgi:hypothetical protein